MKRFWVFIFSSLLLFLSLIPGADGRDEWERQLSKYARIYSLVKEHYPGKIDEEKMVFSSIRGLLATLDPHSYFLDADTLRTMFEDQKGNYFGIGIRITKFEDRLTVVAPLKDTPAYRMGILAGDVIVEIEGENTQKMSLDDAMIRLRGARDTRVNIKIKREGIDSPIPFRIKRAEIPLNSLSYSLVHPVEPGIGYISLRTFGNTTAGELRRSLEDLVEKKNIKALILDLRGNNGGALSAAVEVSDAFLPRGKAVVSIKGRNVEQNFAAENDGPYETLPLAVLIDRGSASASEIVASALKDHKRATVVGSRSYGKGLVETLHRLSLNCALALTSAKYYTPANRCLQRDFSNLDDYIFFSYSRDYDSDRSIKGGVIPDVYVKGSGYPEQVVNFISRGVFFRFSRQLIAADFPITRDFRAETKTVKKFENFLKENKIKYDPVEFKKNVEMIKHEIARDLLSHKFSVEEGLKVFLEFDPATRKAVEILKEELTGRSKNGT